jgi:uroporphyrinogen-III synthase
MRINNTKILITGDISGFLLKEVIAGGIDVDVIPFIQTKTTIAKKARQQIKELSTLPTIVIFTSSNAVEAINACLLNKKPNWKIYVVGNSTASLVKKFFQEGSLTAIADNAVALAEKIISDKNSINEVYFFCGDKRRDELPALLAKNNIVVNEIKVYTTTILHHKIEKDYDGILFFSPSAVEGFFSGNVINKKTVLFAIGDTTAGEIKKFSNNEILISDKPEKKALVEKMISFLKK